MSKATKIIAGLGVVAGLGVAALPMASYAAEVAGEVEVRADVGSAIAMTITGNNDAVIYNSVGVLENGADVTGLYTYDDASGQYTAASGTADGTTEYFRLGGGVSTFNPSDAARIGSYITANGWAYDEDNLQTSGSKTEILPNAVSNDDTFKSSITVWTNDSAYSLTIEDADTETALVNTTDNTKTIPAGSTLAAGTAAWAYKNGTSGNWTAITSAAVPLKDGTGNRVENGELTEVYYGVSTSATQATGTYTDTIVYTATTAH